MLSLALLTAFETMAFFLLLWKLIKDLRLEKQSDAGNAIHHFRGVVLMTLGMMLSLAETLIGFAPQSFALAITRRGMKSAGRILMLWGVLEG